MLKLSSHLITIFFCFKNSNSKKSSKIQSKIKKKAFTKKLVNIIKTMFN